MKGILKNKRAIVGIEAAIILIAFVVIASAIAYVTINMGFFSAQKAKDTISQGVSEATSALQLDGSVIGKTNADGNITYLLLPVKLSVGKAEVDLDNDTVVVSVYSGDISLLDIYNGTGGQYDNVTIEEVIALPGLTGEAAMFVIYNDDNDTVLELNEKAFLVIHLADTHVLASYQKAKIEVRTGQGAALTVERQLPGGLPQDGNIDLG